MRALGVLASIASILLTGCGTDGLCRLAGCGTDLSQPQGDGLTGDEPRSDITDLQASGAAVGVAAGGNAQQLAINQFTFARDASGVMTWTSPKGLAGTIDPTTVTPDTWGIYYSQGEPIMGYLRRSQGVSYVALSIAGSNITYSGRGSAMLAKRNADEQPLFMYGADANGTADWNPLFTDSQKFPAVIIGAFLVGSNPPLKNGEQVDVVTIDASQNHVPVTPWRIVYRRSSESTDQQHRDRQCKLIPSKDGFCYLSWIDGDFRGPGERVRVGIADDGYWYLVIGRGGGSIHGQAQCVSMTPASPAYDPCKNVDELAPGL